MHGVQSSWVTIAEGLPGRDLRAVRKRWCQNLDPTINKGPWTQEEQEVMLREIRLLGTKWTAIAKQLPGRTGGAIANWYYGWVRKNKRQMPQQKEER